MIKVSGGDVLNETPILDIKKKLWLGRGAFGAFVLGLGYCFLSGACTFGFIAPILGRLRARLRTFAVSLLRFGNGFVVFEIKANIYCGWFSLLAQVFLVLLFDRVIANLQLYNRSLYIIFSPQRIPVVLAWCWIFFFNRPVGLFKSYLFSYVSLLKNAIYCPSS